MLVKVNIEQDLLPAFTLPNPHMWKEITGCHFPCLFMSASQYPQIIILSKIYSSETDSSAALLRQHVINKLNMER